MAEEDFETLEGANEQAAKFLGYCGLVPFVFIAVALWLPFGFIEKWQSTLTDGFLLYSAIMLTFLSGIHFGKIIHLRYPPEFQLVISIIPPIVVWFAFMMPTALAILIFIAAYVGQWIIDRELYDIKWFVKQRTVLTFWVVLCQIMTGLGLIF